LALCDQLLPIMIERDIIQKILDTENALMDRADSGEPLKVQALKNLTKCLTTICKLHHPSIDRFLELDGFQTVSRLLDLKNMEINVGLLPFIALVVDQGPDTVVPTMIKKDVPKKLCLFWEDTPPFIKEMTEKCAKIKKWDDLKKSGQPINATQYDALNSWRLLNELMECGFYVFNKLSEKDLTIFKDITPRFHYASACHLMEFVDNKLGQNCGLQFMARLEYTPEDCTTLIDADFVLALFNAKLAHISWHSYGLNCERVILKLCGLGAAFTAQLKAKDAAKVVVATLHFIHDDEDDDDAGEGFLEDDDVEDEFDDEEISGVELGADIDWSKLTKKQEAEVFEKGFELLEMLLDNGTFKTVQDNLAEYTKKIITKVPQSFVPKIRIELATLAVMNMMPKFGMDSLKNKNYTNAYKITDKIASVKYFPDKEKCLSDGIKCYTSYIGLTA
jgi:hypothetical protein